MTRLGQNLRAFGFNNRGFTLVGILWSTGLMSMLMLSIATMSKSLTESVVTSREKSSLETIASMSSQLALNPLTCSCIVRASNGGAGAQFKDMGSGVWAAEQSSIADFAIAPFSSGCATQGTPLVSNGQSLPGSPGTQIALDFVNIVELSGGAGTRFQADLLIRADFQQNAIIGSKVTEKRIPLVVTSTLSGGIATLTACSDEAKLVETTPSRLVFTSPTTVRYSPYNQTADKLVIRMNDGTVREKALFTPGLGPIWNVGNEPMLDGVAGAGPIAANTGVNIYAVPNGNDFDVISSFRGAAASPASNAGPAGFSTWAYLGFVYFNAGGNIQRFMVNGDEVTYETSLTVASQALGSPSLGNAGVPIVPISAGVIRTIASVQADNGFSPPNPLAQIWIGVADVADIDPTAGIDLTTYRYQTSASQPNQNSVLAGQDINVTSYNPRIAYNMSNGVSWQIQVAGYKDPLLRN